MFNRENALRPAEVGLIRPPKPQPPYDPVGRGGKGCPCDPCACLCALFDCSCDCGEVLLYMINRQVGRFWRVCGVLVG